MQSIFPPTYVLSFEICSLNPLCLYAKNKDGKYQYIIIFLLFTVAFKELKW